MQQRASVPMRLATISDGRICVYEIDHAAASNFEDSSASTGTLPFVFRLIGSHHFAGTPRWRHFLRANSVTPSSSAALSTNSQSSGSGFPMPGIIRDDLSPRQETNRPIRAGLSPAKIGDMTTDADGVTAYYIEFCARTKTARKKMIPVVWSMQQMADRLGVTHDAYKKYESRTPMPHHLIPLFCDFTHVTREWLMGETPEIKVQPRAKTKKKKLRLIKKVIS
jgi:hypothetical protein